MTRQTVGAGSAATTDSANSYSPIIGARDQSCEDFPPKRSLSVAGVWQKIHCPTAQPMLPDLPIVTLTPRDGDVVPSHQRLADAVPAGRIDSQLPEAGPEQPGGGMLDLNPPACHRTSFASRGEAPMLRRLLIATAISCTALATAGTATAEQRAFGQAWGGDASSRDWNRFYHYPYVYYPQNFWGQEYFQSSDSLYYRYPPEMRIPVYNKRWHNYYPSSRRYHSGHHFRLDVF